MNELMGNTRQAIKWLEIVNTRAMHDAGLLAMLGSLHAKLNDEPKALHYYSESHRAYPANMDITSWLGAYYVKNEVYEKAMPFFDLASKIQPTEVPTALNLDLSKDESEHKMRCLVQLFIRSFGASWLSKMYLRTLYTIATGVTMKL